MARALVHGQDKKSVLAPTRHWQCMVCYTCDHAYSQVCIISKEMQQGIRMHSGENSSFGYFHFCCHPGLVYNWKI